MTDKITLKSEFSRQARKMSKGNGLDVEINQAYINLVGEEYATAEDCAEAYAGQYDSDEDFARQLAEDAGVMPDEDAWPLYCIDWDYAAREIMMDYQEEDGYYFVRT